MRPPGSRDQGSLCLAHTAQGEGTHKLLSGEWELGPVGQWEEEVRSGEPSCVHPGGSLAYSRTFLLSSLGWLVWSACVLGAGSLKVE